MRSPRRYSTEAIIIRHLDFGESDRILTLYTPGKGKLRAIAKGVRRSRSRSAGHLDLFTRASVMIAQGRNLDIVTQAQALEYFSGLRTDLMSAGYAHYVAELLDSFVPDHLPNSQLYALQLTTLRDLAEHSPGVGDPLLRVRAFEMALLDLSGYRPELHRCLACTKTVVPEANRFSSALGGVLCAGCHNHDPQARDISIPGLKLLRNLQTGPDRVLRLQSVDARVGREVESRIHEYIAYRLEKQPKSVAVLTRLESRQPSVVGH
jgi:DNA repair protein RecO (recombination protein O)